MIYSDKIVLVFFVTDGMKMIVLYLSANLIRKCLEAAVEVVVKQMIWLYNTTVGSSLISGTVLGCISHMAAPDNQLN